MGCCCSSDDYDELSDGPASSGVVPSGPVAGATDGQRRRVLAEILQSEESYVHALIATAERIAPPLRTQPAAFGLTLEDVNTIFLNTDSILHFHRAFLFELKSAPNPATVFVKYSESWRLYVEYVTAFPESQRAINAQTNNKAFQKFLLEKKELYNGMSLPAFLMNPIKRLARYDALLSDLQRLTPAQSPDMASIETALVRIKSVVLQLSDARRTVDATNSLLAVTASMVGVGGSSGPLLHAERKLIRDGVLSSVDSNGQPVSRQVFLLSDMFVWASESNKFKGSVDLVSCKISDLKDNQSGKFGFVIHHPPPKPASGAAAADEKGAAPTETVFVVEKEEDAANWLNDIRQTRVKAATSRVRGKIDNWAHTSVGTPSSATH